MIEKAETVDIVGWFVSEERGFLIRPLGAERIDENEWIGCEIALPKSAHCRPCRRLLS